MTKTDKISLKPIVIVLVGDSTVANYPVDNELRGWGQIISEFFSNNVKVKNFAVGGRSSKSFIKEGLWNRALENKADFVMIQFGHNDCPGKADRTTDPEGDFKGYILKYIADCRESGAQPILVTPMERRNFTQNGKIALSLDKYAAAMKEVGKKENVPVIDLHNKSVEFYESLGEKGCNDMGPKGDRTHFTKEGAMAITRLIAKEIHKKIPLLAKYLKNEN